jgi:ribosomal protein S25
VNLQTVSQEVERHHRLLIWAGVLIVLFSIGVRWIDYRAKVADRDASVAEKKVEADKDAQKAADNQAATDAQAYKEWKTESDKRVDGLYAQINSLSNQLQDQRNRDRVMTPSALAERWNTLISVPAGVNSNADGLLASVVAAQATVSQLEEIPSDRQTIQNQVGVIAERDSDLKKKDGLLSDSATQLAACKKEASDADDKCNKEKSKLASDARKGKLKTFLWGAGAALATLLGLKHGI